jgi:hypothetical protein
MLHDLEEKGADCIGRFSLLLAKFILSANSDRDCIVTFWPLTDFTGQSPPLKKIMPDGVVENKGWRT